VVDGARRDEDVLLDFPIFELFEEGLKNGKRNLKKMQISGERDQKKGCIPVFRSASGWHNFTFIYEKS
jgi:hypothetical protein